MSEIKAAIETNLKQVLECMLFVSAQPLVLEEMGQSMEIDPVLLEQEMHELRLDYADRGLQIIRVAGGYQMCTRPEFAQYVSALLKPERIRLSRAALETVAIVAYRQPITQPEVEAIRGVNCDGVMKTLTERALIKQTGRKDAPGRPILYITTDEFLNHFGLGDLAELPELDEEVLPAPQDKLETHQIVVDSPYAVSAEGEETTIEEVFVRSE